MNRYGLWLATALICLSMSMVRAETPVARGSYLVNGILTCGNCHTPKGPTVDIMDYIRDFVATL